MKQLLQTFLPSLISLSITSFFVQHGYSQWSEVAHTWMTTREGGTIPNFIQYVDNTNQVGIYGDFDSAVAGGYSIRDLGNTLTLTNTGWKSAGHAYNYSSAYSLVLFHNKLFGSDYIIHTESPYFKKLNTVTNTYEGYMDLANSLSSYPTPNFRFYQWKNNVLLAGKFDLLNGMGNLVLWNMDKNSYSEIGGGSLGYNIGNITSFDISDIDSTVAFICTNTNDAANGLRVLYFGDSTWANSDYPTLPTNAAGIQVANKNEIYVVTNSPDPTNKFAAIYVLNIANKTWDKIITCTMANRLLYPDIKALAYGNGALHFMGTFDSCNGHAYPAFTTFHYVHSAGFLQASGSTGLHLNCLDDYGNYYTLFWAGNTLYLGGSGGLCGLNMQAFVYSMHYVNTLPIVLSSFTAESVGDANRLQWKAALSSSGTFNIQRSNNGRDFATIEVLPAKRKSAIQQAFSFLDYKPYRPVSYYRLQLSDENGMVTYSSTQKVDNLVPSFSASLRSTTVQSQLVINLAANTRISAQVSIYSASGKAVMQNSITVSPGVMDKTFEVGGLANGMYFIKVLGGSKAVEFKFLKL